MEALAKAFLNQGFLLAGTPGAITAELATAIRAIYRLLRDGFLTEARRAAQASETTQTLWARAVEARKTRKHLIPAQKAS